MKKLLIFEMPCPQSKEESDAFNEIVSKMEKHSMNEDFHVLCLHSSKSCGDIIVHTISPKIDSI